MIPCKNQENYEIHKIQSQKHENHETLIIPKQNQEKNETPRIL